MEAQRGKQIQYMQQTEIDYDDMSKVDEMVPMNRKGAQLPSRRL